MKERINKIIQRENISPSKFADIIGVQRSSVSHILSGRNNPGLDFLYKILLHFPHISGDWLITGQGPMVKLASGAKLPTLFDDKSIVQPEVSKADTDIIEPKTVVTEPAVQKTAETLLSQEKSSSVQPSLQNNALSIRKVEKIVVFYNDNSFKEYLPERSPL